MDLKGIKNKRVIVRVDFNVPVKGNVIVDSSRVLASKATIDLLTKNGCKVILISHFGRPSGFDSNLSFLPLIAQLAKFLDRQISFCNLDEAKNSIETIDFGQVLLVDNIRFYQEEEKNEQDFAKKLSDLADFYVNDAFSVCHRNHASVTGVTKYLKSFLGISCQAEVDALSLIAKDKKSVAIIGGSKISTKLPLISGLIKRVDKIILGGALANTILKNQGYHIGKSLHEDIKVELDQQKIFVPFDFITSKSLIDVNYHIVDVREIPKNEMILDIGPASFIAIKQILKNFDCIFWNGPVGAFEYPPFDIYTKKLARHISHLTKTEGIKSIIGGGDTLCAINMIEDELSFFYKSNAGGAFLKFLEYGNLIGLDCILK